MCDEMVSPIPFFNVATAHCDIILTRKYKREVSRDVSYIKIYLGHFRSHLLDIQWTLTIRNSLKVLHAIRHIN